MKKAFTLLELIVVIIIIGILATLGFAQYGKTLEKTRVTEAKMILGQMRKAEEAYYLEYDVYTNQESMLAVNAPPACTSTHYFRYAAAGTAITAYGRALRCTTGGKPPDFTAAYEINLTWRDGVWGGYPGLY